MKTKKKKLLPVKEVRALVEKQLDQLTVAGLTIHRLKEEIKSLDGARANLRMMYQSNTEEMVKAKQATVDALASVRMIERQCDGAISAAEAFQAQVRGYEAETPAHMIRRGLGILLRRAVKPITSFFERVKYRIKGRG